MAILVMKWTIVVAAIFTFGFMVFDGCRALAIGDYIRPTSGRFAGQLGPWSNLIRGVGIDPESTLMRVTFVIWGLGGLAIAASFACEIPWAWGAMLGICIATLWYLVPGTVLCLVQIVLLLIIRVLR